MCWGGKERKEEESTFGLNFSWEKREKGGKRKRGRRVLILARGEDEMGRGKKRGRESLLQFL